MITERGSVQLSGECLTLFPTKIVAQLSSWKRSTYEDFATLPHTKSTLSAGLAGEDDLYFTAVIDRCSGRILYLHYLHKVFTFRSSFNIVINIPYFYNIVNVQKMIATTSL